MLKGNKLTPTPSYVTGFERQASGLDCLGKDVVPMAAYAGNSLDGVIDFPETKLEFSMFDTISGPEREPAVDNK